MSAKFVFLECSFCPCNTYKGSYISILWPPNTFANVLNDNNEGDGTFKAYETWVKEDDNCSLCQCANNEIRCTKYDHCSMIPHPSTVVPTYSYVEPTISKCHGIRFIKNL